jgi:hypothetical protein
MFLALMVGTPGSPAPPPMEPAFIVSHVDVGAPRSPASPTKGPIIDIFCIGGGCSRIFSIASKGARCRCFLALMLGTPGFCGSTF